MIDKLLRKNIRELKPYSSARKEYSGVSNIQMDANESPFDTGFNRYPDPLALELKAKIASLKKIRSENIFLGNGSDEAIDLLMRAFCIPGEDVVLQYTPTYGMYEVSAAINDIKVISLPLSGDFKIKLEESTETIQKWCPKLVFICSPNNPTGNLMDKVTVENILMNSPKSIVVMDEAYIDFAADASFLPELDKFKNLVILQTFSKALGMAGIRLGLAYAHNEIINILNKIKPPYNISDLTQKKAIEILDNISKTEKNVDTILRSRKELQTELEKLPDVRKVFPSDANFLLVEFEDAKSVKSQLDKLGIIVRDRSSQVKNCLRITVGTDEENRNLIQAILGGSS